MQKNLNNVVIPANIKEIGDNAFSWCESLTNLTISEGVEHIGEAAFFRCNSLNEVTIPRSVTQIDMHAFGWDYVDDYDVRNENLVIKGYSGTAAEQYARDNGFKCILLDTGEVIEKANPQPPQMTDMYVRKRAIIVRLSALRILKSAEGDPDHSGIEFCLEKGIMNGTSADTFSPTIRLRARSLQPCSTVWQANPMHRERKVHRPFAGLVQKAVNWAAANGIINGTSDTTFSPNAAITREQAAAISLQIRTKQGA